MGNSLGGFRLLRNDEDGSSYHFQLGKSVTIDMKDGKYKWEVDGKLTQTWEVSYNVDGLTCKLSIVKTFETNLNEMLEINIEDSTCREKMSYAVKEHSIVYRERIKRSSEAGLLDVSCTCSSGYSTKDRRDRRDRRDDHVILASSSTFIPCTRDSTNNSTGVTTSTTIDTYGSGTRQGLFVREWKKKKGHDKPYMGTIAHYYAYSNNSREAIPRISRIDIGLSIVVKIRVSGNGDLDFTVDGPVQHPSSALFYMFEEVQTTGAWNPMACPHCANIQRQRRWMLWQSENEDSDGLPPARAGYYGRPQQNARNNGVFVGDANGGIFENNIMFFGGRS